MEQGQSERKGEFKGAAEIKSKVGGVCMVIQDSAVHEKRSSSLTSHLDQRGTDVDTLGFSLIYGDEFKVHSLETTSLSLPQKISESLNHSHSSCVDA